MICHSCRLRQREQDIRFLLLLESFEQLGDLLGIVGLAVEFGALSLVNQKHIPHDAPPVVHIDPVDLALQAAALVRRFCPFIPCGANLTQPPTR